MTAFLSGEMKDTVEVNPAGSYGKVRSYISPTEPNPFLSSVLEKFFSRKDRARLFRSWAGG